VLLGKMKEIVVASVLGPVDQVYGRKNSFEQLGFDMMIDEDLNPWLIEVNSSPAMDYSTPITRKLVKMVMEDIVKIVVDLRKKKSKVKTAGEFRLVYSGEGFKSKYYRMGGQIKGEEDGEE
jgi:tubulin monoglycylase TTLL3/8